MEFPCSMTCRYRAILVCGFEKVGHAAAASLVVLLKGEKSAIWGGMLFEVETFFRHVLIYIHVARRRQEKRAGGRPCGVDWQVGA